MAKEAVEKKQVEFVMQNENVKLEFLGIQNTIDSVKLDLAKAGWKWQPDDSKGERTIDLATIVRNLLYENLICSTCKHYQHREFIRHNNMGFCTEDDTSHMFSSNGEFNGDEFGCIRHSRDY